VADTKDSLRAWRLSSEQRRYVFEQLAPGMERLRSDFGVATEQWGFGARLEEAENDEVPQFCAHSLACGPRNGD